MKNVNQLVIRPFQNQDMDAITQLLAISFQSKFKSMLSLSSTQIASLLKDSWDLTENNPEKGHFVAKIDDAIAGVILLKYASQKRIDDDKTDYIMLMKKYGLKNTIKYLLGMFLLNHELVENECYIEHIAIDPDCRGMGIGTILINHAREFAKTLPNISTFSLSVAGTNISAYKLYKQLQFKEIEEKTINSYLMKRLVGENKWLYMAQPLINNTNLD